MVNYPTKPGLYLMHGDNVKSLSLLDAGLWPDSFREGAGASPRALADMVAWVFIALNERRGQIDEIANVTKWMRGETEQDIDPLGFMLHDELARIDEALQMPPGYAVYHKTGTKGNSFVLQWLDPSSIKPDKDSYNGELRRYDWWIRSLANGKRQRIEADKLLVIQQKGQRELSPATTAGMATRLAGQILSSMDTTLDDLYDRNFMPIALINVPMGTSQQEKERVQSTFKRLFNRLSGPSNKTIAVERGPAGDTIGVETISLAPDDLELTSTADRNIRAVLLAHDVPTSIFTDVNKAEAGTKDVKFVQRMLGRVSMIARTINNDPDVMKAGYMIKVNSNQLEAMQQAELQKAEALQRLTGAPVMTVNEARERLELEPMAGHDEIVLPGSPFGALPQPAAAVPDPEPSKAFLAEAWQGEKRKLQKFVSDGNHKRRKFKSNILPNEVIAMTIQELDPDWWIAKSMYP